MVGAGLIAIVVGWIVAMSLIATRIHSRPPAAFLRMLLWDASLCVATAAAAFLFLGWRAGVSAVTGLAAGALLAGMAANFWTRRSIRRQDQG